MKNTNVIDILEVPALLNEVALEYKENLLDKNYIFIYGEENAPKGFEAEFLKSNFQHLTGVRLKDGGSATKFFNMALRNELTENNIVYDDIYTTPMKLSILPNISQIAIKSNMIGAFAHNRNLLYSENMVGTVYSCMGFREVKNGVFRPDTFLKEDIRVLVNQPQKLLLTLSKDIKKERYEELTYIGKNVVFEDIKLKSFKGKFSEKLKVNIPEYDLRQDNAKNHKEKQAGKKKNKKTKNKELYKKKEREQEL